MNDTEFMNALFHEDDLGSVIRVHLHIEHYVNELINVKVPNPDELKSLNLDFSGKVSLLCALGVDPEMKPMLSALASIRNSFAHKLSSSLGKSEVNNLYKSLSSAKRELFQASFKKTKNNSQFLDVASYNELNPKMKFILLSMFIKQHMVFLVNSNGGKIV